MDGQDPIEVPVVDARNAEVGKVRLPAAFGEPVREGLLFEQVLAQRATRRSGAASTKTRAEVSGGGKKPWRQKGTGRARAGSSRSPIWRGGGATFGPRPRSYGYRLPRSARKAALASALAQKARDGQVRVIDSIAISTPKTKSVRGMLEALGISSSVLIVSAGSDRNLELSARNLPYTLVLPAAGLNVYDVLRYETLLIQRDALAAIEERFAQ
jgi:large subunit ribosomal protein L4